MKILKTNVNNKYELKKLGYNSNKYYCGNYSMQNLYSYIYNVLRKKGIYFAFNRACFIHDVNYSRKPNLDEKKIIDKQFYVDMQKCIIYHYNNNDIDLIRAVSLRGVAWLFYYIVQKFTALYIRQGKIKK